MGSKGSKAKRTKPINEYQIYTLGIAGVGKSTLQKQIQIIYNEGFTEADRSKYKNILITNIIVGFQDIVSYLEKHDEWPDEAMVKKCRFVKSLIVADCTNEFGWVTQIKDLWKDEVIKKGFSALSTDPRVSMLSHHMTKIDDYINPGYLLSDDDILRARQRTTGSVCLEATINKSIWKIIDVGGQGVEREKWAGIIENETTTNTRSVKGKVILFFISLIDYNVPSSEDPTKTNFQISEELFEDVIQTFMTDDEFILILCLNKIDEFEKKIQIPTELESFKKCFPDYVHRELRRGKTQSKTRTMSVSTETDDPTIPMTNYLGGRFKKILKSKSKQEETDDMSIYVTCGLDTNMIKQTIRGIVESMFNKTIRDLDI